MEWPTVETWSATALWLTLAVFAASAIYARHDAKVLRESRRDEIRPYVVVLLSSTWIGRILIENFGNRIACDVTFSFDPRLVSSFDENPWDESTLFTDGVPVMSPGFVIRFDLDSFTTRLNDERLPSTHSVEVSYADGDTSFGPDRFVLDFELFSGARPSSPVVGEELELIEATLKKLTTELKRLKWQRIVLRREKEPEHDAGFLLQLLPRELESEARRGV